MTHPKRLSDWSLNDESLELASSEAILLTEEVYEEVVNVFRVAGNLCIEGNGNGADLITEDTDCMMI